jgi:hypothetical protein
VLFGRGAMGLRGTLVVLCRQGVRHLHFILPIGRQAPTHARKAPIMLPASANSVRTKWSAPTQVRVLLRLSDNGAGLVTT